MTLANEAAESPEIPETDINLLALPNEFHILQDRTLLVPYGDQLHEKAGVIQRLNRRVADTLVANFRSLRGKLARRFAGLPFYVGHPDHPDFSSEHTDRRAYGWIMDIAAQADGLALEVNWSEPGRDILANKHYAYFSPHWGCNRAGEENGLPIVEPVWFISCGFTNSPQWPVYPLANQHTNRAAPGAQTKKEQAMLEWLRTLFGLANDAGEDAVKAAITAAHTAAGRADATQTSLANETQARTQAETRATAAETRASTAEQSLAAEQQARTQAETSLANERKARIEAILDAAQLAGKITPADRPKWAADLTTDFDGKSAALANAKPVMKTRSQTAGLKPGFSADGQSVQAQIQVLVNERAVTTGLPLKSHYHQHYLAVKAAHPELFKTSGD